MTYSLPVTSISYKQLEEIQKRARRASLGKMGYNQQFPLAVVYDPKSVGALDLVDLTMEQGIRVVESFLYHKFATDGVSRLMDISLRYSQMEAGRPGGRAAGRNPCSRDRISQYRISPTHG